MLFALITGWIVQHYSFVPAFVLFGILPAISAVLIWTLPKDAGFIHSSALPEIGD
jgi:ACS family hexuronate transporter-like MFS transporter